MFNRRPHSVGKQPINDHPIVSKKVPKEVQPKQSLKEELPMTLLGLLEDELDGLCRIEIYHNMLIEQWKSQRLIVLEYQKTIEPQAQSDQACQRTYSLLKLAADFMIQKTDQIGVRLSQIINYKQNTRMELAEKCKQVGRMPIPLKSEAALLNYQQWTSRDQVIELSLGLYPEIVEIYALCDSAAIGNDIEQCIKNSVQITLNLHKTVLQDSYLYHLDFYRKNQNYGTLLKESREDKLKVAEACWKELKRIERRVIEFVRIIMMIARHERILLKYLVDCTMKRKRSETIEFLMKQYQDLNRFMQDVNKQADEANKHYTRLSLTCHWLRELYRIDN